MAVNQAGGLNRFPKNAKLNVGGIIEGTSEIAEYDGRITLHASQLPKDCSKRRLETECSRVMCPLEVKPTR